MRLVFESLRTTRPGAVPVWVKSEKGVEDLRPYHNEVNHSPDGFNFGYGGSGAAQLAYAILRRFFSERYGDEEARRKAQKYYQDFKWEFIATIKGDQLSITSDEIESWFLRIGIDL